MKIMISLSIELYHHTNLLISYGEILPFNFYATNTANNSKKKIVYS